MSLLIPAIAGARRAAANTACASQLHQLCAAVVMYLGEHRHYPDPSSIPAFVGPVPLCIRANVLNAVGPYVAWTELAGTERVDALPPPAACNVRLQLDILLDPYPPAAFGLEFWNTGYSYCGGLMEVANATSVALKPDHIADRKGRRRGVLWADNLILLKSGGASQGWAYWHLRGGHSINPALVTVVEPTSYAGHHVGWSDGSVEFSPRGAISLDPADADTVAAYKVGTPALTIYHYF